jgi:hypothetical protein
MCLGVPPTLRVGVACCGALVLAFQAAHRVGQLLRAFPRAPTPAHACAA